MDPQSKFFEIPKTFEFFEFFDLFSIFLGFLSEEYVSYKWTGGLISQLAWFFVRDNYC